MTTRGEFLKGENIFLPDKLEVNKVVEQINNLKDGETLKISHAFLIVRLGGINIAVDPAIQARSLSEKEENEFIPPSQGEASKSKKKQDGAYAYSMIEAPVEVNGNPHETNTARVGRILAQYIDAIFISHLHTDHYDFELIRTIMETNSNTKVYGPLGWQGVIAKYHSLEITGDNPTDNYLPEYVRKRMKSLSAKSADPNRDSGLNYPNLNLDRTILNAQNGESVSVKAIDIPHAGGLPAEFVQGFVLESKTNRILLIPDAALSPEIIKHIKMNAQGADGNKLTQFIVSTATLNPESFYGILNEQQSYVLRDEIEEGIVHSAYLPLVAAAYTEGETPISIVHSGFYYRSSSEESNLRSRYPEYKKADNPTLKEWLSRLRAKVDETLKEMEEQINTLGPLSISVGRHGRSEIGKLLRDFPIRRRFARKIVEWIKKEGVPDNVLEIIHSPQANEIIK